MKIIKIPKKSGGVRTIYVPDAAEKASLRSIAGAIERKARKLCPEGVVHGFTRGRSPVTNALAHVGYSYTTCFDLQDFFDSVTLNHVKGKLKREEMERVLVGGAARQGLPTSPAVANLAAADMDRAIITWRDKHQLRIAYTRYADDLSFSYDDPAITDMLLRAIPEIVGRCGFRLNVAKTRTMCAKNGRRIITGVAVDGTIHPPRAIKRRLRAAIHQGRQAQARGLAEWCQLRPPRNPDSRREPTGDEITRVARAWRLPRVPMTMLPQKGPDESLGGGCVATGDPIYMLGMSTWTTGWRSCMTHPDGEHRMGVIFWALLRGTRIAAYLGSRTMTVAGVTRHAMRARALVYEMRNSARVYDTIYGNPGDTQHLEHRLREAGYISVDEARAAYGPGVAVVGHVPARRYMPHFDSMQWHGTVARTGRYRGKRVIVVTI